MNPSRELSGEDLKVLSISVAFPNPGETNLGAFVRSRLHYMTAGCSIQVVAPVPLIDYSQLRNERKPIPRRRRDGPIEVRHPRWFYPPKGGALNVLCLYAAMLRPLRLLRRSFEFRIIDAHFGHPTGSAAALLARAFDVPFFVTLRGDETMHAGWGLRRRWMSWAFRRAARVITVSERLRQFAISLGASPERVKTIPNGIDAKIFHSHDRASLRAEYGFGPGPVVLSAGALIERKGHHRTIRAVKSLRDRGIPAQVVIAGSPGREGEFEARIRATIAELGMESHVRFLGQLAASKLAEVMCAADVFCLATTREGWPNVVHEAMGCGTPVVVSDVGAVPDLVPSADYGFVVPVGDQTALEDALARALTRDWDRAKIEQWAQSRSWEHVAEEVLTEMRSVLGGRARQ